MKKINARNIALFVLLLAMSCKQETIDLQVIKPPADTSCEDATAGSIDLTKFIAIGTSFTAGVQAGALFDDGQNNSLAAILNKQFVCAGAPATFKQPTIHSALGFNIFIVPNPDPNNVIYGRFLLQYNGATSPLPTPQVSTIAALPNPTYNPGFIYQGASDSLNNFSVEAITMVQFLIPNTGNWGDPNPTDGFSPFYARFASDHGAGGATIATDAAAAGGTFFMFWGGMDDYMLYAAYGGDYKTAPLTDATSFSNYYGGVLATLFGANPSFKGVLGNFPDIFKMPHFTSVPWNAIVFTEADQQTSIAPANAAYAVYNGGLDQMVMASLLSAAEADKRKINFAVGANGIVIEDLTLTDLRGFNIPSIRQSTSADIFPLAAGSVLGTEETPGNASTTWGVGKALTDRYVLIPSEIDSINTARGLFNSTVASAITAHTPNLALADVDAGLSTLVAHQADVVSGVTVTPNIDPPTGIYSEDGLHPNTRGYAYISNFFIEAINKKFGSTVPMTNVAAYSATALPIP